MSSEPSLILASASPRRRELLVQIGIAPEVHTADVDEQVRPGEAPAEYVLRLAIAKAETVAGKLPEDDSRPVLAADTAVVIDHHILGKPADRDDAFRQLRLLSGREHRVLTGVALAARGGIHSRLSVSHVRIRALSDSEIQDYWATGEPADKAGSYGIQGLAAIFIEEIHGSYSSIMGLPLFETAELLRAAGHSPLGPKAAP